jgi:hypothetical protein
VDQGDERPLAVGQYGEFIHALKSSSTGANVATGTNGAM